MPQISLKSDNLNELGANFKHQALHAKEITFIHPKTKEEMTFSCDIPEDMQQVINMFS